MLRKVLLRSQRPLQLFFASLGAIAGVFILLVSIQFFIDLKEALTKKRDLLGADYLVVQKSVSTLNTLGAGSLGFSSGEISDLMDYPFVEEVGIFESSQFKVFAAISGIPGTKDIFTDAFFEAVPDRFIDISSKNWYWEEGNIEVPVILPSTYLDAFNFGFGPSQGLPPLSEKAFKMLTLKIKIKGSSEINYRGKIVGFSDRINTILVPLNFLRYANRNFSVRQQENPSRLILAVTDISHPGIARMMDEKGLDTNRENLRGSRVKTILIVLLSIFLFVGGIIVLLSLLGFIQYSQILISKANYELRVLLLMGYKHSTLAKRYIAYSAITITLVMVVAYVGLFLAKAELLKYLKAYEMEIPESIAMWTWISGLLLFLLYMLLNGINIVLNLRRLAKTLQG
ncbi:MAG: hypothetical protein K1X56_12305 [Flavobacteriales bacterium]|nr:hypothetical protein [Flavobacteriales bacterium]